MVLVVRLGTKYGSPELKKYAKPNASPDWLFTNTNCTRYSSRNSSMILVVGCHGVAHLVLFTHWHPVYSTLAPHRDSDFKMRPSQFYRNKPNKGGKRARKNRPGSQLLTIVDGSRTTLRCSKAGWETNRDSGTYWGSGARGETDTRCDKASVHTGCFATW